MRLKQGPVRCGLEKRRREKNTVPAGLDGGLKNRGTQEATAVVYFGPTQGNNSGNVKEGAKTRKESWTVFMTDWIFGMKVKVRESNDSKVSYSG